MSKSKTVSQLTGFHERKINSNSNVSGHRLTNSPSVNGSNNFHAKDLFVIQTLNVCNKWCSDLGIHLAVVLGPWCLAIRVVHLVHQPHPLEANRITQTWLPAGNFADYILHCCCGYERLQRKYLKGISWWHFHIDIWLSDPGKSLL